MTKEEAIKYFEKRKEKALMLMEKSKADTPINNKVRGTLTRKIEALDMAISALKGGWIPVEKRNPKQCGVYYVTRLVGDGFEEQYITDASFFDGTNKWHNDNRINHDRDYLEDVVAWFEAEPYKKGE